jgi:uncharacterized protein (DUF58 family)
MNRLVPANMAARAENVGRMPFGFARRFFLLLFVGLVWIAPAWQQTRFLYVMAAWDFLVLAAWAFDLRRLPRPEQIEIRRIWTEPLGLAQNTQVSIEVANSSAVPIFARMHDEAPDTFSRELPGGEVAVPGRGSAPVNYTIRPRARGDATLGDAWLRYSSSWYLAERWVRARLGQSVRVYPNLEEAKKMRVYLIRSRQIELEKRLKRQRGLGREFESLREYRSGDEFRDICWTATARRGKLITKMYQIERSQTLWIVLDAGRLLRARVDGLTKLDFAVNAALSLAQIAFYSGDRVALLAYGRKPQQRVGPGRGMPHLRILMESLAQVRAETFEANHLLAAEMLLSAQNRRSLVVWMTDLAETAATPEVIECAAAMAGRHLVVLGIMAQKELLGITAAKPQNAGEMYRYTAALEIVQRRDLLLRRLRQQGAMALEAAPGGFSTALVNQYLEVKERGLL